MNENMNAEEYFESIAMGDTVAVKYGSDFLTATFRGLSESGRVWVLFPGDSGESLVPQSRVYNTADADRAPEPVDVVTEDEPPYL